MIAQLIQPDLIALAVALHSKPPLKRKGAYPVGLDVIQRHKPRACSESNEIFLGDVKLNVVVLPMAGRDDIQVFQVSQCAIQRAVERSAWRLTEQLCEPSPMNIDDAAVHVARKHIPADTEKCLEPDQTKGALRLGRGMADADFHISGDDSPKRGIDGLRRNKPSAGMALPMTGIAQCDAFAFVGIVQGYGVLDYRVLIAIKLPQAKDDMIERDNMVALKVHSGVTFEAVCAYVTGNPLAVFHRYTNGSFDFFDQCKVAALHVHTIRSGNGICVVKKWDLRRYLGFGLFPLQDTETKMTCGGKQSILECQFRGLNNYNKQAVSPAAVFTGCLAPHAVVRFIAALRASTGLRRNFHPFPLRLGTGHPFWASSAKGRECIGTSFVGFCFGFLPLSDNFLIFCATV